MKHSKLIVVLLIVVVFGLSLTACFNHSNGGDDNPPFVTVTFIYGSSTDKTFMDAAAYGGTVLEPNQIKGEEIGTAVVGWYKDKACTEGQEWNFKTDKVMSNMTLYAKWGECEITIGEALEVIEYLWSDEPTEKRYLIRGKISEILDPETGKCVLDNGAHYILVSLLHDSKGENGYSMLSDKPLENDEVLLRAQLKRSGDNKKEICDGWVLEVKHAEQEE